MPLFRIGGTAGADKSGSGGRRITYAEYLSRIDGAYKRLSPFRELRLRCSKAAKRRGEWPLDAAALRDMWTLDTNPTEN